MLRISHRTRLVNALGAQTSRQTKTLWKLLLTPLTGTALLAIMLPEALHPAPCELLTAAHSTQMALQRCVVCSPLGAAQVAALPRTWSSLACSVWDRIFNSGRATTGSRR